MILDLLPGLYLAGLTWLLAAVLARWYDPLPRKALWTFGAVIVLLFGRVLFLGDVLLPLDNLRASPPFQELRSPETPGFRLQVDLLEDFAPYYAQVRRSLAALEWPLLNPLVGAGEPLLVNTQAQHFHPFMVLTYLLPLASAVGLVAALKVLVALVFSFLLFRRLGLGEPAALAGSLAYGMGGFMLLYLAWPQTQAAAALPVLLYALDRAIDEGARRDLLLLAPASAMVLLGGHPETMLYTAGTGAAFALARLATRGWRSAGGRLLRIAACGTLTVAVLAPVLLPTWLYLDRSERHWLVETRSRPPLGEELRAKLGSAEARRQEGAELARRTLPLVAPAAYGHNLHGHYWGATAITQDAAGFFGSAAILAAVLTLLPLRRGDRRFPAERLFLGLGIASLVFVARPPGLESLMQSLPGLSQSASQNRRLALVICFCGAYLAACTWERWQRRAPRRPVALAAAGALGALVAWAYLAHPHPEHPETLAALRLGFFAVHLVTLAATAWLLAAPRRRAWMPWGLAVLVAVELYVVHGDLNPAMPKRLYFPDKPSIQYLQRHLGDHRIVGMDTTFRHNIPVIYGVADVRSGNPLQPALLFQITRPLRETRNSRKFVVPDHPLYDLLGVRYVVTGPFDPAPLPIAFDGDMRIYERPAPLPRLFLPASAEVAHDRFFRRLWGISDFAERALLSPDEARDDWRAVTPAASSIEITRLEATRIEARARIEERRLLASRIYQDGGWRLLVDGRPRETLEVNGPFVGAWLEPGEQRLELVYRPPGFLAGCVVAALALALGLVGWLPRPRDRGWP